MNFFFSSNIFVTYMYIYTEDWLYCFSILNNSLYYYFYEDFRFRFLIFLNSFCLFYFVMHAFMQSQILFKSCINLSSQCFLNKIYFIENKFPNLLSDVVFFSLISAVFTQPISSSFFLIEANHKLLAIKNRTSTTLDQHDTWFII